MAMDNSTCSAVEHGDARYAHRNGGAVMFRLLVLSDTHCGHLLGLTPPDWVGPQNKQWAEPFWAMFREAVDELPRLDAVVYNGDLVDGPGKKDTENHLTTDMNNQLDMAEVIVSSVKTRRRYFVRGTGFHVDNTGNLEEIVARRFDATAQDELRLQIHGRRLHFRHVVGRSDIPYGQYTQLAKEQINDLLQAQMEDYDDADVLIRSHVHYCVQTAVADGNRGLVRHAVTTPALQLRAPIQGPYTRKLRTWLYHVGILYIEIDTSGEVYIRPRIFPIKLYTPHERRYECLTSEQTSA